ncbi:MAG: hypothetical protein ABIP03_15450 [Aquihabitans sp.]
MTESSPTVLNDEELVVALAPMSLRSTLDTPGVAAQEGRPVAEPGGAVALFDHYESGLFDSPFAAPGASQASAERRNEVAVSVAFQAVVAQVVNPVLLAHRVLGIGVAPDLGDVRWRADGWGTRFGLASFGRCEPRGLVEVISMLEDQVVKPWLAVVLSIGCVPERTLRGNACAALWTAVQAVDRHVALTAGEWAGLHALGLSGGRDTCCLIHHAGLVACDECPRAPA